jgi:phenylalanyl-tRNA synthetase beta chain
VKITLNWLRELVDVVLSPEDLAETLIMAGLEVESIEERNPTWKQVEIATIESVTAHPNADRLRLCQVRKASETVAVVCGASNMKPGDRVALAVPGAVLPDGKRIEQASIRGQTSHGMLCSAREIGLTDEDTDGILILPPEATVGTPLVTYLGAEDAILELSLTPNRGDCLSVLGVAREVAALTGATLRDRPVAISEEKALAARIAGVDVQAPDLCPRYSARIVRGLHVGASPLWMQVRLSMVGLRPISNVVDATNYVMLERGQPLHAFDLARLRGTRVTARRAGTRQRYETLDGVVRELLPEDLVIADAEGPVAVAGVIGGADSEIRQDTVDVLLESAFFTPETVRRTARRLGVNTESSYRFERGVDPAGTRRALDRVTQLIVAYAGGQVARGVLEDRAPGRRARTAIRLRPARVNALLGTSFKIADMERPLRALGATVSGRGPLVRRVVPPSHRFDLQGEVDLVEEIARGGRPRGRSYARRRAASPRTAAGSGFRRDGDPGDGGDGRQPRLPGVAGIGWTIGRSRQSALGRERPAPPEPTPGYGACPGGEPAPGRRARRRLHVGPCFWTGGWPLPRGPDARVAALGCLAPSDGWLAGARL